MQIDLSLFGSKARPLIGLDISTSAVKLVELSGGGKEGYRVERYTMETLAKDVMSDGNIVNLEAAADAIKKAWKRMATPTRNVALALPTPAVITKKIIVPEGLRENDFEELIESEASQYVPFSLDEVNLDFQIIGPAPSSPGEIEVLIAASRKERVEDRLAVAEAAGLKPVIVDIESYATLAAFELIGTQQLPENGRNQIVALVDIGAHATHLTVFRDAQNLYAREQAFGGNQLTQEIARHYGMSFDEAEAAKRSNNLPSGYQSDLLSPFIENVALEVARALQFFFTSTPFNQVHHLVLAGGGAALPGVDEAVAARTQVNTIVANPFAGMTLSDKVKSRNLLIDAPSLLVSCGLALRRFDS